MSSRPPRSSASSSTSAALFEQAQKLLPGGVNSPVRAFTQVEDAPRFVRSGQGCTIVDEDGQRYIDYVCSWGPLILGHAHPAVLAALEEALRHGTSFGAPTRIENELAADIIRRVPTVEKVRMVNSGTEAVMSALRLARAVTGRNKLVKFDGCYHGHVDAMLVKAGSGLATLGLPGSPGINVDTAQETWVLPFNDAESVSALFERCGRQIAAVIVEPVAGNMGVIPPAAGFLEALRDVTGAHGALLIFDEVMTGFRLAAGGAQQRYGVQPDLTTMGKVIGGGMPVGAYGGPAEYMDQIAPAGPVYQAGTLSGNPLSMAGGLATLQELHEQAYATLEARSQRLHAGLADLLERRAISGAVQRVGSMLSVFFGIGRAENFQDVASADHRRFAAFFRLMLERGIYLPPSGYEAWFVSLAHDEEAIDRTLACADEALAELAATSQTASA